MFIDKIITLALGSIFLFLLACDSNQSAENTTRELTYQIETKEPSAIFWDYAATTSMLQSELSMLAAGKTTDTQVTVLADSALLLHTNALKRLHRIAEKYKDVQLPDSLSGADKEMVEEFKLLDEQEFATRYREYLELTHKTQLSRYSETLSETEDPALRQWLQTMREKLRGQLVFYASLDTTAQATN